jgi:hypothetical protein
MDALLSGLWYPHLKRRFCRAQEPVMLRGAEPQTRMKKPFKLGV